MDWRSAMSPEDLATLGRCLWAAVEGPFFEEWEFQTLIGVERQELARLTRAWPEPERSFEESAGLVSGVLANLLGYPHGQAAELERRVGLTTLELSALQGRLRALLPGTA